jgi:sphinganine-1-phosphate aldolase
MKKKVALEMGQAKLDIENKLVPKGATVTRHLTLPDKGRDADWILEEMTKMDEELNSHANWRHGKLSGAVYRMSCSSELLLCFVLIST